MANLTDYEYDIFLSHNHADQDWTTNLAERLEQEDWQGRKLKVFFSPWDIRPGQSIPQRIEQALPKSRKVGLILSPDAMKSAWVELERLVTTYIAVSARDERLIPLYRRDCEIPALLQPILYLDFRDDNKFDESYGTLLSVIKDEPLPRRSRSPVHDSAKLSPLIPRPPVVGFVARRDSEGRDIVARLKEELAPQRNQLIALSGPGGVGKTTLAAEAARAWSEIFGGRVVWVGALGRKDFSLSTLLDEVAALIGRVDLRSLTAELKAEQIRALLAADPALIILDNFETITEVQRTQSVQFLLETSSCPALITTRQKIASARNISISVMSATEADDFLQRLIKGVSDPSAFAHVDRGRLMTASERNPSVMEWVIGQIDLAQDAETVLHELTHGLGDAAQRVFDRSFGLEQLADDGRATLLALSLFAPDASRSALAKAAGFGDDLSRLSAATKSLASLYLIKSTASGERLTVSGLTRELATVRLAKHEHARDFQRRFIAHFLAHVLANSQPASKDFEALEAEKDNVLRAMDTAFEIRDWQSVKDFMRVIGREPDGFLDLRGYWDEAIKRGEQAVEAAQAGNDEFATAVFAGNIAVILQRRGQYDEARRAHQLALESFRKLGSDQNVAVALHCLAMVALDQGELEEAQRLYNESLDLARKLNDPSGIALSLLELGRLAVREGEDLKARRFFEDSLEISKSLNDQNSVSLNLHNLAFVAQNQKELEQARQLYLESLEIARELGNQGGIATTLNALGVLSVYEGNQTEAARLFREALTIFEKLGSPDAEFARQNLARVEGKSS